MTHTIWRSLGILTSGIPIEQQEILRAVVEDRPGDEPTIDEHLRFFLQAASGR